MASEGQQLLGRSHGDAENLFPRYTVASAATTGEVEVNGKVIHLWEYAQLEPLSVVILRKRATALRDAIGADNCPPIPCGHAQVLIRYILDVQAQITKSSLEVGPPKLGRGNNVPGHFLHATKGAGGKGGSGYPTEASKAPFGPRTAHAEHVAKRDSFRDLRECKKEFEDPEPHMKLGIQSLRPGGEGRKHLFQESNLSGGGVALEPPSSPREGRKYLGCRDNVAEQKKYMDAVEKGLPAAPSQPVPKLSGGPPDKHPSNSHMREQGGVATPVVEPHIGGERRRHIMKPDNMLHVGTSKQVEEPMSNGRRHLNSFDGPRQNHSDSHTSYQATWRKDPSRLQGTSLII